jgi:hypothetical protein
MKKRRAKTVITSRRAAFGALVLLFAVCALLPSAASPAPKEEKPSALIFGTVWGADNRPAYGIKVKVRRAGQNKAKWEIYSDHHGEFALRVPAGAADYVLWADVKTASGQAKPETKVHVDNDERVDVSLHLN